MEEIKKTQGEGGDKEILYSKAIKAGKRIYYLDVKKNLKDDLFLAITESKKIQPRDGAQVSFEKHKIFLYKEDFEKFINGMNDVIRYIQQYNADNDQQTSYLNDTPGSGAFEDEGEFKLDLEF